MLVLVSPLGLKQVHILLDQMQVLLILVGLRVKKMEEAVTIQMKNLIVHVLLQVRLNS